MYNTIKVFGVIIWRCYGKTSLGFSEALDERAFILNHSVVFTEVLPAIPLIWYLALDYFNAEKYLPAARPGNKSQFYQPNQPVLVLLSPPDSAYKLHDAFSHSSLSYCMLSDSVRRDQMALSTFCLEISLSSVLKFTRYIFYLPSCHMQHFSNYSVTLNTCCPSPASNNFSHCSLSLQQLFVHHPSRLC